LSGYAYFEYNELNGIQETISCFSFSVLKTVSILLHCCSSKSSISIYFYPSYSIDNSHHYFLLEQIQIGVVETQLATVNLRQNVCNHFSYAIFLFPLQRLQGVQADQRAGVFFFFLEKKKKKSKSQSSICKVSTKNSRRFPWTPITPYHSEFPKLLFYCASLVTIIVLWRIHSERAPNIFFFYYAGYLQFMIMSVIIDVFYLKIY